MTDSLLGFTGLQQALDLPFWPGQVILWALFMMSLLCWSVILSKAVSFFRAKKSDADFLDALNSGRNPLTLYARNEPENEFSIRSCVYQSGAREMTYQLLGSAEIDDTLKDRIDRADVISAHQFGHVRAALEAGRLEAQTRLKAGFGVLGTSAFVAPMIGVLGCAWLFMSGYEGIVEEASSSISPEMAAASLAILVVSLCVGIPAAIARLVFAVKVQEREQALGEFSHELCKVFDRYFVSDEESLTRVVEEEEDETEEALGATAALMADIDPLSEPNEEESQEVEEAISEDEEPAFESEEVFSPFELVEDEDEEEMPPSQPHHQPNLDFESDSQPEFVMEFEEDEFEEEPPMNPIARQAVEQAAR